MTFCGSQIEEIENVDQYLVNQLEEVSFPRLIALSTIYAYDDVDKGMFSKIVAKNANLQRLHWGFRGKWQFPLDVINENLKELTVNYCNHNSFRSFTGRMPNLECFYSNSYGYTPTRALDDFLESTPRLTTLDLDMFVIDWELFPCGAKHEYIKFNDFVHIWKLSHLTSLTITFQCLPEDPDKTLLM